MDKALRIGEVSASGSLQLFIGKTVSTVIMAVGAIILGALILQADYGLYTIALIPAATISLFQDWGVGSAMIKYCAQFRAAAKDGGELRQTILSGLTFEIATGVVLTLFSILTADFVALVILHKPESAFLITLVSLTIFFGSILSAAQSIFVGFERMGLITWSMICQAVAQCVVPVVLVYAGYGAYGAVLGYVSSSAVASLVAAALLYFVIFRKISRDITINTNFRQTLKLLLHYGIPLATATIIGSILTQFNSFMMASLVDESMIGNFKIATNFAILLTFFTTPISTVLFPAFSKIDLKKEAQLLKTVFAASVKYAALFLIPATMAMMVLSKPIIGTFYGDKWSYASSLLSLYVVGNLFIIFGSLSITNLIFALGETKMLMKLNILALIIGIPMSSLLIPEYGIPGMIIVGLTAGLPGWFISLYWIWKRYGIKVEFQSSVKIFVASSIATILTFLFQSIFAAPAWIMFTMGVILFLTTYLTTAPLVGAINQTDINNLRVMFLGLGIVSKLLEIPIMLIEKLLRTMHVERA